VVEEEDNDDENAGEKIVCTMIITILLYYNMIYPREYPAENGLRALHRDPTRASGLIVAHYSYIYI